MRFSARRFALVFVLSVACNQAHGQDRPSHAVRGQAGNETRLSAEPRKVAIVGPSDLKKLFKYSKKSDIVFPSFGNYPSTFPGAPTEIRAFSIVMNGTYLKVEFRFLHETKLVGQYNYAYLPNHHLETVALRNSAGFSCENMINLLNESFGSETVLTGPQAQTVGYDSPVNGFSYIKDHTWLDRNKFWVIHMTEYDQDKCFYVSFY